MPSLVAIRADTNIIIGSPSVVAAISLKAHSHRKSADLLSE